MPEHGATNSDADRRRGHCAAPVPGEVLTEHGSGHEHQVGGREELRPHKERVDEREPREGNDRQRQSSDPPWQSSFRHERPHTEDPQGLKGDPDHLVVHEMVKTKHALLEQVDPGLQGRPVTRLPLRHEVLRQRSDRALQLPREQERQLVVPGQSRHVTIPAGQIVLGHAAAQVADHGHEADLGRVEQRRRAEGPKDVDGRAESGPAPEHRPAEREPAPHEGDHGKPPAHPWAGQVNPERRRAEHPERAQPDEQQHNPVPNAARHGDEHTGSDREQGQRQVLGDQAGKVEPGHRSPCTRYDGVAMDADCAAVPAVMDVLSRDTIVSICQRRL